jgi:hypothetical protein
MEYEGPSGLALTGHDDNFEWIELMAQSPSGEIIERTFVQIGDHDAIEAWPQRFGNTGVSHSICVYAWRSRKARYVVPFYLHARSDDDLEGARRCLVAAGEQVLIQMDGPPASVHWYFDGNNGFELLIPFQVFDAFYSPWIFPLYADIAAQQDRFRPGFLDVSIYSQDYTWTFPNSRGPSGLYKIPLTEAEISELSANEIVAMAVSPRPEDSHLEAYIGKYAPWWFTSELKRIEEQFATCPKCSDDSAQYMQDHLLAPCVQTIESAVLPEEMRHTTCYSLASVYAGLNMHYPEIVARLQAIDARNPILNPNDIAKAAEHGCRHPCYPPCGSVLRQFCRKESCEYSALRGDHTGRRDDAETLGDSPGQDALNSAH